MTDTAQPLTAFDAHQLAEEARERKAQEIQAQAETMLGNIYALIREAAAKGEERIEYAGPRSMGVYHLNRIQSALRDQGFRTVWNRSGALTVTWEHIPQPATDVPHE